MTASRLNGSGPETLTRCPFGSAGWGPIPGASLFGQSFGSLDINDRPPPLTDITRVILVDVDDQDRLGLIGKVIEKQSVSIPIWDHHPLESTNPLLERAEFLKLESVGATITLLVKTLQEQSQTWAPEEATLFAIALYEETGHFTYLHTTPRDLQVGAQLIETGADLTVVNDVIQRKWTEPQVALFKALLPATQLLTLGQRRVVLTILAWPSMWQTWPLLRYNLGNSTTRIPS